MESLHPEIYAKCRNLFEGGDFAEAVEKSFKLVETSFGLLPATKPDRKLLARGTSM